MSSVSECLFGFLESLNDPVIPYSHYKLCIDNSLTFDSANKEVNKLPAVHFNTFHYLMSFLREVLRNSDANNLSADQLASGIN